MYRCKTLKNGSMLAYKCNTGNHPKHTEYFKSYRVLEKHFLYLTALFPLPPDIVGYYKKKIPVYFPFLYSFPR